MPRARPWLVPTTAVAFALGQIWLAFGSGGFFAGQTAIAVIAAGIALVLWLMLARRPFDGLSRALAIAVGAGVLLAVWTLMSQSWSGAEARAVVEFDRALLYVLVVALAGLAAAVPGARRATVLAVAGALTAVCACALVTRLLPDVWPTSTSVQPDRLSYPVSYWNALGLMGGLGFVACLHLASSVREPRVVRCLAAAAMPVLAVTVLFTFSRGALAVTVLGAVAYIVLARSAGAASALLAAVPGTAIAVAVAYGADATVSAEAGAGAEGRQVALVVVLCAIAAGAIMAAVARRVDARAGRIVVSRRSALVGAAAVAALLVVAGIAVDVPGRVSEQIEGLGDGRILSDSGDPRERLSAAGNNGRTDVWVVAVDAFGRAPLAGEGAGTYPLLWSEHRPVDLGVADGHSLLLETLAELGIVGGLLVVLMTGTLLVGAARRIRGPDRAAGAVAFVLFGMWLLRAQIDWDWEMPALTIPVLAIAAVTVGRPTDGAEGASPVWPGRLPRLVVAIALLLVLMTPLGIARSQIALDEAVADLRADRCPEAIAAALRSTRALSSRPEPFEVLGLCDARLGRGDLAQAAMEAALARDPDNWQLHYGLGVILAAQGLDPTAQLQAARQRNPRSKLVRSAVRRLSTTDPDLLQRRALSTRLPF